MGTDHDSAHPSDSTTDTITTNRPAIDYDAALAAECAAFLTAAEGTPAGTAVPWCPGWTIEDLVWHLGAEVQHFWGYVLRVRPDDPSGYVEPERPADLPGILAAFRDYSADFLSTLAEARDDDESAWTWHANVQNVGFIRRRQAHEALIHRLDAENARGIGSAIDPVLAADGVEEYLDWILGGKPSWATFVGSGRYAAFLATDTGRRTVVEVGRLTGTPPGGEPRDEVDLAVVLPDQPAEVTVSAPAAILDTWLWHRTPADAVTIEGDSSILTELAPMLEHKVTNGD